MTAAFLALDYMVGLADQPFARDAVETAAVAIGEARRRGMRVVFTKAGFRPGHPDVSPRNRFFGQFIGTDALVGDKSRLVAGLTPHGQEPVLDKKRFSALAGNELWTILRAQAVTSVVICGLSTSGVVLATAMELADADLDVTILSDACADPDGALHEILLDRVLRKRAAVLTVAEWRSGVAGSDGTGMGRGRTTRVLP